MCSKVRLLRLLLRSLLLLSLLLLGSRVSVARRKLCATAAAGLPSGVDEALQQCRSSVSIMWKFISRGRTASLVQDSAVCQACRCAPGHLHPPAN